MSVEQAVQEFIDDANVSGDQQVDTDGSIDDQDDTVDTGADDSAAKSDTDNVDEVVDDGDGMDTVDADGEVDTSSDKEYISKLEKEVDMLKAKLETLINIQKGEDDKDDDTKDAVDAFGFKKPEVNIDDIVGNKSIDEFLEKPEEFTSWAKVFAEKIIDRTLESVYQSIPELIKRYADETVTVRTYAERFYKDNPDLEPYKAEVARIANVIAQAEPNLPYDEFFKKVADYARYHLGLVRKSADADGNKQKKKPALPGKSTSGRRKPEVLDEVEKEIMDLIKTIG